MEHGSYLFTADGRVITVPKDGVAHEATDEERARLPEIVWPFWWHIRMPARGDSADG